MHTPAGFEQFAAEVGELALALTLPPPPDGPPDFAALAEAAARHQITILAPPPQPCACEQYGGDGRACQPAAADDHERCARRGGVQHRAPEEVADGRGDAHPAVDVGQDPAEHRRRRGALKVRRHMTVRQEDRETAQRLVAPVKRSAYCWDTTDMALQPPPRATASVKGAS